MLKKIGVGIVGLVGLLLLISLVLPSTVRVERSTVIAASPEEIFSVLIDYRQFNAWSPWSARDLEMVVSYEGPATGLGSRMIWSGNSQVGEGWQEIIESVPFSHIGVLLDFGSQGQSHSDFDLSPGDEGTIVVWSFETDLGMNPISRYFGLMMDKWIGTDYAEGLANLKVYVEGQSE
jgi:hypothetical protein